MPFSKFIVVGAQMRAANPGVNHMPTNRYRWFRFSSMAALALAVLLTGCERDSETTTIKREVTCSGTVQDPYLLCVGGPAEWLDIAAGKRAYFRVDGLAGETIYTVRTTSSSKDDVDLVLNYSDSAHELAGGVESCWFITEIEMGTAFGHVDGTPLSRAAMFTVSVALGAKNVMRLPAGASKDFQGYTLPGAAITGILQAELENVFYQVFDSTGALTPFPGNEIPDQCDVNTGTAATTQSCDVFLTGPPGHIVTVTDNGAAKVKVTLILNV